MTRARDIADLGQDKTTLASYVDTGVTSTDLERIDITTEGTSENSKVVTADSSGHVTLAGELRGPATLVIDPAVVGNNTGLLQVKGNLQVDGTTTTINSTTLTVDDKNIVLGSGAADSAAADGSGITIDGASATMLYTHSTTSFDFNKPVNVTGALTATSASFGDGNITNVGDIALDTISSDAGTSIGVTLGTDSGDDFNVGSGKLVVEGDTGNVGIGTASPSQKLEISDSATVGMQIRNLTNSGYSQLVFGTGSSGSSFCIIRHERVGVDQGKLHITKPNDGSGGDAFTIDHTGKVGIGTATPQALVVSKEASDVVEGINFVAEAYGDTNDTCGYYFASHGVASPRRKAGILLKKTGDYGVGDLHFVVDSNADDASISQASDTKMTITSSGNVGIGDTSPLSLLDIGGATHDYGALSVNAVGSRAIAYFQTGDTQTFTGTSLTQASHSDSSLIIRNNTATDNNFSQITFMDGGGFSNAVIMGRHIDHDTSGGGDLLFFTRTDDSNVDTTDLRMIVKDTGKVGIGTASPTDMLSIQAASSHLRLHGTSNTNKNVSIFYNESGDYGQLNCDESGVNQKDFWITGLNLKFGRTTSIEHMRITSDGDIGVRSTSPLGTIDLRGQSGITSCNNLHLTYIPNGAATDSWYINSNASARLYVRNRSTSNGAYLYYGSDGWSNPSDRRWKKDWTPITGSLEKLLNIEVAKYHLLVGDDPSSLKEIEVKEGLNKQWNVGVSAQDCLGAGLEDIVDCPVLDGSGDENSKKGVNYNQLTAICVQAIQELSAKVTALESA